MEKVESKEKKTTAKKTTAKKTTAKKTTAKKVEVQNEVTQIYPLVEMTQEEFKDKIFNYDEKSIWDSKIDKPAIVDFYADWCAPCKALEKELHNLASDLKGSVDIYRINVEKNNEIAAVFGIKSIPSLLLIPVNETPKMNLGFVPKNILKNAVIEMFNLKGIEPDEITK